MNVTRTATLNGEPLTQGGSTIRVPEPATAPTPQPIPPVDATEARPVPHVRLRRVLCLMGVLLLALCVSWWHHSRNWVSTDNASVSSHIHQISPRISGTIQDVLVDENQAVEAGQLLARLDPRDLASREQQSLAQLAQARAGVNQAEALIAQAAAMVDRETANTRKAQLDFERAESLYEDGTGAISRQEFDQARATRDACKAGIEGARAALQSASANASSARALEQVATASLEEARLQSSYTGIQAPVAGRIGRKNLEIGNRVQPGQVLLALVDTHPWIVANFKETQISGLLPGQDVQIRIDAFPGRTFRGRVGTVSPASGAMFALLPPDNATGNFTRIVQRVPVKIVFDGTDMAGCETRIVPGMSAMVRVHTGK